MAFEAVFRSADRHRRSHRDFVHFAADEAVAACAVLAVWAVWVVIYSSCRIR